jgi:outer membrane protein OmpA-like peptidoglycan-associated protein
LVKTEVSMSFSLRCKHFTVFHTLAILGAVLFLPSVGGAQSEAPKYDIFVGYQFLHPGGQVGSPQGTASNPMPQKLGDMPVGIGSSFSFNFSPLWGLEADVGHNGDSNNYVTTVSGGPRIMFRMPDSDVFLHGLVSYSRLQVDLVGTSHGIGGVIGGGFDLKFTRLVSWRVMEADWLPSAHHFSQFAPSSAAHPGLQSLRLRTGLLLTFDYPTTTPVGASVSVQPTQVMVGEPLTATATASNFNPKHTLTYDWSSNCGKIEGKGETASIDTAGASGGACTASVRVTDPKAKKNNEASASTSFTVKEPPKNPPTISCSASPTSVQAGATVTVTCSCTSPDNVPVSVGNYTANGGTISGSGNTAALNTTGASPGTITVNANCSDQRGLSTPAATQVTVETPPPPSSPLEARLALHSVYFATAQPTPANPKGGLVMSQQATLTSLASDFKKYLQSKPDAHLILEGHTDPRGAPQFNQSLSERRVARVKSFLMEQGVPEANLETKALGESQQLTADEVKSSIEQNPQLTPGERERILKNMRTILLASNRRVDVTLNTTGQQSVRQFPFSAEDSLTLIGGREKPAAPTPTKKKKAPAKKK